MRSNNFLNFCDSFKMLYSIVKTSLIDEPFYNGLKAFASSSESWMICSAVKLFYFILSQLKV